MPTTNLVITDPGMLSLVVDAGRDTKAQETGFCASGAIDQLTFELVNWLCGNELDAAALECIGAVTITVDRPLYVAVGGPQVSVEVNQQPAECWQSLSLRAGDSLAVTPARLGTKTYIGLGGKLDLPVVQGSQSIVMREGAGGLRNDGKPLQADDRLAIEPHGQDIERHLEKKEIPDYQLNTPLDVVLGYQVAQFSSWQQQLFFASEYAVTNDINRMGFRLKGQAISPASGTMYSEGINCGSIQFPPDGQPIIMLADRQTLGGYPKLGCVADYDLYRLAQAVPGDTVTFTAIDYDNARAKWLLRHRLEELIFDSDE